MRTTGPIIELGGGWYSTPIINTFSYGRLARTIESDPVWFEKIAPICLLNPHVTKTHQIVFAPNYDQAPIDDVHWSVGFIDHEPPARRGFDLTRLRDRCDLIIVHDSEQEAYNYQPTLGTFRFQFTWKRYLPWTTVVSDSIPLDWLDDILGSYGPDQ